MSCSPYREPDGAWRIGPDLLHPGQDPLGAAQAELAVLLAGATSRDLLVLAGGGLGWHAEAVLASPNHPQLLVYEPDQPTRKSMAVYGPDISGLEVAEDHESLAEMLGRHLVYGNIERVAVFSPPAYRAAHPELTNEVKALVRAVSQRSAVDRATKSQKNSEWLENIATNFKHVLELPDLSGLAGRFQSVPCLVVGAGPSLDQSLPIIEKYAGNALIIGAASALTPLRSVGVYPKVAVALEARDESRQFKDADAEKTMLAAASASNPRHFTEWPGMGSIYHLQPWVADLVGAGHVVPSGGHAGSAAFSLAILWGCSPVILVGQDLAYTGERFHAGSRPGGEDYKMPQTTEVPAINGGTVPTSSEWQSYIGWYQEAVGYLNKIGQMGRVVNATADGAKIPGMPHRGLSEVMAGSKRINLNMRDFVEQVAGMQRPNLTAMQKRVAGLRKEVVASLRYIKQKGLNGLRGSYGPAHAISWAMEPVNDESQQAMAGTNLIKLLECLEIMEEVLNA